MYTHNFDIEIGDCKSTGEISFNGGSPASLDCNINICTPVSEINTIRELFDGILSLYNKCGEITKFKIIKK